VPKEAVKPARLDTLPPEFEPVGVEKLERVEAMLVKAVETLRSGETMRDLGIMLPLDVVMKSHANKDGSFDAEVRLRVKPADVTMKDLLITMENAMKKVPGIFVSVGLQSSHPDDFHLSPEIVVGSGRSKHVQVGTHYYRHHRMAETFLAAEDKVYANLIEKGFHEPDQVYVRVHWNPEGIAPGKDLRFKSRI
jgi:hypothetical protein